jgi:hypothetical protein
MNKLPIWLSLGIFLVGGILMKGQQPEATDYTNSTISTDNTTILIEEEMEQDEINDITPTQIEKERVVNANKKP